MELTIMGNVDGTTRLKNSKVLVVAVGSNVVNAYILDLQ
jgi:hypothetical protein